jgi:Domain of unknown function (DUF4389)
VTDVPAGFPAVPPPAVSAERADEVLVAFVGPAPQRRLTVFFRLIMVIPQFIVLYALNIAAEVVLVISWFAALFTGRVPAGLADFLAGYLRWYSRVAAYVWLLTDTYPPFALGEEEGYPIRVSLTPGRLNRLAVLFRLFLAIPALIVAAVAGWGIAAAALVIWLIVLIAGRMPDTLYQALAAILRYLIRLQGYWLLLSATYPGGLFGDRPGAGLPAAEPATPGAVTPGAAWTSPAAPPQYGEPGPAQPDVTQQDVTQQDVTLPGYGQPPAGGAAPGVLVPDAAGWRLVLSSGARKLVGFFLALGVVAIAAYTVVMIVVVGSAGSRVNAVNQVSQAHTTLVSTVNALQTATAACQSNVSCVTRQDGKAADAFLAFNSTLGSTAMPDSASTAASQKLQQDTARIAADFRSLSQATSASQYQQTLASSGLQQALTQFDTDYQQLGVSLGAVNR